MGIENIPGFCKTFEKVTKNLGFHLTFKTANLQAIIFTSIATDIKITINSLYLFVPIFVPSASTQAMFNNTIIKNYTSTFDSWYTEHKISNGGREYQVDIGSAQNVNTPKYLTAAFQTHDRIGVPSKARNIAISDNAHF